MLWEPQKGNSFPHFWTVNPQPQCHDLAKWLSHYLYFFSFLFLLDLLHKEGVWESVICHRTDVTVWCHTRMKSHDNHGKVVYRLCSSCISSIQEMHKDSIEFFLLSTDKGAVGFILVQKLAILTLKIYNGIKL